MRRLVVLTLSWYIVCTLLLIFSLFFLNYQPIPGTDNPVSIAPSIEVNSLVLASQPIDDVRILTLIRFFQDYQSPLIAEAKDLVRQADLWGIDYTLIPAISMQESQGCKKIPFDSYNCWGFGIYGTKTTKFSSYKQAIAQIAKTIKETYIRNGLTNVTLLEDRWAPQSRGQWSSAVNFFIGKIKEYEKNIPNT